MHLQFAEFAVKLLRNYGHKTTSRTESSHAQLKSYLRKKLPNLLVLHEKIFQMVKEKESSYKSKVEDQWRRHKHKHFKRNFLRPIVHKVTFKALDSVYDQYTAAVESLKGQQLGKPGSALPPCTGAFEKHWGIPCRHTIFSKFERGEGLSQIDFDVHWWLDDETVSLCSYNLLVLTVVLTGSADCCCDSSCHSRT